MEGNLHQLLDIRKNSGFYFGVYVVKMVCKNPAFKKSMLIYVLRSNFKYVKRKIKKIVKMRSALASLASPPAKAKASRGVGVPFKESKNLFFRPFCAIFFQKKEQTNNIILGGIVQMVERMLCTHEVVGSNPVISNKE